MATDSAELSTPFEQLCRASLAMTGEAPIPARAHPHPRLCAGWDAFTLATTIAADSPDRPDLGWARGGAAAAASVSKCESPNLGPRAKLQRAAAIAKDVNQIHRYAARGARLNMSRNSDAGPRSSVSGERRRGLSCVLTRRPNFPPTGDAVLARPSLHRPFAEGVLLDRF